MGILSSEKDMIPLLKEKLEARRSSSNKSLVTTIAEASAAVIEIR